MKESSLFNALNSNSNCGVYFLPVVFICLARLDSSQKRFFKIHFNYSIRTKNLVRMTLGLNVTLMVSSHLRKLQLFVTVLEKAAS